ncbi:sigma-54 dependent transcriptional regulator [Brevibacillus humidisoli]|uniref:sigma-54-dependent transcriptional regulator n=1 Tax=Brevibacillus humidisoli TaxID=2895522 RepID=UPI001E46EAC0|nr:sigma-54 dependent transcriptional regulator [Brevibacillus humidisoli]UFJ41736.1 sigma-54 dependent transcriptional regulator [Brevibacillus humidisoli]
MKSILFIDDESKLLRILQSAFEKKGYRVYTAHNGNEASKQISANPIDIIFLDLMLPDTTGLELLQEFLPLYPQKVFILMTAYGDVESAVTAMKAGAFDYIVKPAKMDVIEIAIKRASEWLEMKYENQLLKEKLENTASAYEMVSFSPVMKRILQIVERVANTDATVLLHGESGTGKSMLARIIHNLSARNKEPFVSINCAAIPEQLLESELFGYEKGAFTGANTSRQGKFEAANGGTIFLDEIGDISASLQAKLLQVTQEKTFMRLGSNIPKQVDVRIISATNRDLKKMVEQGTFREDLYYRLNIVDLFIPPLRERRDDIPFFVEQFLEKQRKRYAKRYEISPELMNVLMEYDWPGNVRELENALERAVVLCSGEKLSIDDFPREIKEVKHEPDDQRDYTYDPGRSLPEQLDEIEKRFIQQALAQTNGQAASAARLLGISRQSLLYKMNKYFMT